jgi:hypothetical protein
MVGMRRLLLVFGALVCTIAGLVPAAVAATEKPASPTSRARAESALTTAQKLLAGKGVRTGREVTPALAELARRKGALDGSDRREANDVLARPTSPGEGAPGHSYTVAEHAPFCTTHFCVHYVTSTADAPSSTDSNANGTPDYVETMANTFEFVYSVENTSLGWVNAKSDGSLGGNNKTDAYIENLPPNLFGYAAPEQNAVSSHAYLVMDNDYTGFAPLTPLAAMQVTAAHEYNHVLQFTYDSWQDTWMLESTATWTEEKVYPGINDYLTYVNVFNDCSLIPLTEADPGGACDLKMYGTAVWNHWLDARYGPTEIRNAWEQSDVTAPEPHLAPDAYDESVKTRGGAGFGDEFGRFAAATAEWRTPSSVFPDHTSFPEMTRTGASMTVGGAARTVTLNHTGFALVDVTPDVTQSGIELHADVPAGVDSTIALVGRTGIDSAAGTVTSSAQRLPAGGSGAVSLASPGSYGRITAVLANGDFSQSGFNGTDWIWTRDAQPFQNVRITSLAPAAPRSNPTTSTPKLTLKLALASPQRLRTALRRGVLARVRCNQSCRVRVELRLDRRTARRLHLKRLVGTRVVTLTRSGVRSVRVKVAPRARAKLRTRKRVRLIARMRGSHGSSRAALLTRRVTLKR